MPDRDQVEKGGRRFESTNWTVVLAARDRGSPEAARALESLCRTYWYPLYAFVRRWGHSAPDAEELTQEFFARLIARNDLARVDPAKGKFRTFLLKACQNFLFNERRRRRGGSRRIALDFSEAERRYARELADDRTPERTFDRRWALAVLEKVFARLESEMVERGKGDLFEKLKPALVRGPGLMTYGAIGAALDMTEGAVRVAVHRLRKRYRELIRKEIRRTVADPGQVDDEIQELFRALES
jgi:RNA polymerase sigma-70 factor (ECF subfamily)